MKLESTLKNKAGFLYIAPLTDVVLLLLIFFLFGSNFVLKSGVSVTLPESTSSLPSAASSHIVSVLPGTPEDIFFNEELVDLESLDSRLRESQGLSQQVILLADRQVPYGIVMQVSEIVLRNGYRLSFATHEKQQ